MYVFVIVFQYYVMIYFVNFILIYFQFVLNVVGGGLVLLEIGGVNQDLILIMMMEMNI